MCTLVAKFILFTTALELVKTQSFVHFACKQGKGYIDFIPVLYALLMVFISIINIYCISMLIKMA